MSAANISVIQAPAQARAEHLGLSNSLFCNSPKYAAKLTPGHIVTRKVRSRLEAAPVGLEAARAQVQKEGYNGKMSRRTRANVSGMLGEWFTAKKASLGPAFTTMNAAARLFTFCTLTLCAKQFHSDNHLKRHALGRFIQECIREHNTASYFWRAEPQKNGNIHFHILFAQDIPWQFIRSTWNVIMSDLGYLGLYTARMQRHYEGGFRPSTNKADTRSIEKQVAAFRAGEACGWTNPNSTDIHRLNKTKNAAAYVCKYTMKDAGTRKIEGRIWGCSDNLRELKTPEVGVTEDFIRGLQLAAEQGDIAAVQCEHVTIYKGDINRLLAAACPELLAGLEAYYVKVGQWLAILQAGNIPSSPKQARK